jgi:uncharacterized repeat protein (TIGR04138 family)
MNDIKTLQQIVEKDPRYPMEAYAFVLEALFYSRKKLKVRGHVTGQQLLEGIRDLARERYGLMAKMVFAHWGITKTIDFGHIVFNMVKGKMLGKTAEDTIDDFKDIYDFDDAFVKNYPLDVKGFKGVKSR